MPPFHISSRLILFRVATKYKDDSRMDDKEKKLLFWYKVSMHAIHVFIALFGIFDPLTGANEAQMCCNLQKSCILLYYIISKIEDN